MKAINFTEQELDHLQRYYQIELVEAEKDVESIKTILSKLVESKPVKTEVITEKKQGKRGQKPDVIIEGKPVQEVKRGRKPKVKVEETIKKKRKPRKEKVKPVLEETPVPESILPTIVSKPDKPIIPKKSFKKRKQFKRRGVILTPMGKPLPKKAAETELPPADQLKDNSE